MATSFTGKLIDDLPCAIQQKIRRGTGGIGKIQQRKHLWHFISVQFEDGGELEGGLDNLGVEKRRAEVHVEDANALRAGFVQKALDGSTGSRRALRQCAEADGVCLLGQREPVRSELQKVPGDGLVNGVSRLSVRERHGYRAGNAAEILLDVLRIQRGGIEERHGFASEGVGADASGRHTVVAQARGHDSEVRRSSAKLRALRKHVPKQFSETDDAPGPGHADLSGRVVHAWRWVCNQGSNQDSMGSRRGIMSPAND